MSASSSIISIATPSNSSSELYSSKSLILQTPLISIPKSHFKTPNLSFNFNTNYSNFSSSLRSSSPSYEAIQVEETPETDLSAIEEELENDEDADEEESEPESPDAGKLYVGNLPYSITSSELSQVFGEAGNVNFVEIVYDRVTDRSRGFAFITMASVQEANEAIRMFNGAQIGGRTVKVNFPEVPRGGEREVMGPKIRKSNREFIESPHKIYAGNLSWIITSEKLKDTFADQPGLLSAKVIYEKHSGRSRGYGFVTFNSPEAAESALNTMNGVDSYGGYMVAFAGRKYAARSNPAFIANSTYIVTSFTLVLEFQKGRLQNLYWKRDGCSLCSGKSNFMCLNGQDCAIRISSCKTKGGTVDCNLGIQVAFSGTDKHEYVFNSWYEVKNLRQYSLFGLYKNLKDSLTSRYNSFF